MKIAILFAGQGSQYPGMGKSLYENLGCVRKVLDLLEQIRPGTLKMCFQGTPADLALTANTQPCIFAVDIAAALALREREITPVALAGFSLGEIPALGFSGALSIEDAFKLVNYRAQLMEKAANEVNGAMAAVLKLDNDIICEICSQVGNVMPANFNSPGQCVISGLADAVDRAIKLAMDAGGRAIKLPVSGAFHSPYMKSAAEKFYEHLISIKFSPAEYELYSNVTADKYGDDYAYLLSQQIVSPVRWEETILNMHAKGIDVFIEAGPGKTLSGLVKRILPGSTVLYVEDMESLNSTVKFLEGT
ncbi:MAG TPA: ACP S-malonyltransferase [Clostridia bacterium]|nr:ACP S-malonyltransferase [Clostridia bacterium]